MSAPNKVRNDSGSIYDGSTEGQIDQGDQNLLQSSSNSLAVLDDHHLESLSIEDGNPNIFDNDKLPAYQPARSVDQQANPEQDTTKSAIPTSTRTSDDMRSNTRNSPLSDKEFPEAATKNTHASQLYTRKGASTYTRNEKERSPTRSDAGFDEKTSISGDDRDDESRSEIQNIMDQFSEEGHGPGHEEVMSPRLEVAGPLLGGSLQHPPRKSSLEASNSSTPCFRSQQLPNTDLRKEVTDLSDVGPAVPPKSGTISNTTHSRFSEDLQASQTPISPSLHRPPPPEPEPEPDLPFDFHRFLEQLRHRTADPVAKFLRSFLQEFGKKQWMVHEQVKIISDFLAFITNKMAQCDVWCEVSDAEFDNAREGMEKLVMNRLYTQTFSPAIPPAQLITASKHRRRGPERLMGPGRRGQHQEDVERDEILAQKVSIYGWIKEEHLDIPSVAEGGKSYLKLAQQELLKIKTYRAPRDKIICVLNCCKVIFGLLRHSKFDSSADSFMPLLIYVVLQANPEHLVSNVQYILRFRNQEKLAGEAGYYLSSLLGAVHFIENLDRTTLTISDEDFEKNVEAAVSAIAERHQAQIEDSLPPTETSIDNQDTATHQLKKIEYSTPRKKSVGDYDNGSTTDEKVAIGGLLRSIQRPLSSIGRMFSEDIAISQNNSQTGSVRTTQASYSQISRPASPSVSRDCSKTIPQATESQNIPPHISKQTGVAFNDVSGSGLPEVRHAQQTDYANVVETLAGMFPDLDRDVISDVVTQKNGRVGLAVDVCLALNS
ncbi:vacuolar protein sorting-associated protein 9 [Blumeria hordei DH14]|uniref:Vacuolar protein sorting-associated protein 9 n=1 Tax=Blumeria graminis f. sp. hordei (strain DH14) TaxID=546991 RepID=N1J7K9_BLUG1|nr:vacuolar protein sorting-associated protein 9 [Blumeria hordei DH14]